MVNEKNISYDLFLDSIANINMDYKPILRTLGLYGSIFFAFLNQPKAFSYIQEHKVTYQSTTCSLAVPYFY